MSKPMTVAEWRSQCDKWHVPLNVVGNPETHNRNGKGAWGDVKGFVLHHFGTATPDRVDLPVIVNGHAGLPGPLSQLFLGDDSVVDLVSTGRCNHAGKGSAATYNHVCNEDYTGNLKPGPDEIDFNAHFYGVEVGYSGTEWMGDKRYQTLILVAAAICDFHGWSAKSVIAHYELTTRKWDPGYRGARYDMSKVRADIQVLLDRGPEGAPQAVATAKTPVGVSVAKATVDAPAAYPRGSVNMKYLRPGQQDSWSVGSYKRGLWAAQGAAYKAAHMVAYTKSMVIPNRWDGFVEQMTKDTYLYLAQRDPSWGTGDLTTPGAKLLSVLGFRVVDS